MRHAGKVELNIQKGHKMPKEEVLVLPDARYRVQLDNGISSSPMPQEE